MLRFQLDNDDAWLQCGGNGVGHLRREPFLDLGACGCHLESAAQLADPRYFALGHVSHSRIPEEGQ